MTQKPTYEELEQTVKDLATKAGRHPSAAKGVQHEFRVQENIFQAIGQPALILNPHHEILAANRAVLKITGRSARDFIGQKCYELFHNADQPPDNCPLTKMLRSGQIETEEMEVQAFDRSFLVSCTPVFGESGKISTIIHIATDITERKQTEAEIRAAREHARNIIDSSLDMIISVDNRRRIVEFNRAAEKAFGYHKEEVLGQKVHILYAKSAEAERVYQAVNQTGEFVDEVMNVKKDGSTFRSLISSTPLRDARGNLIGNMGVSRDIEEKKQAEEEKAKLETRLRQAQKMEAIATLAGGIAHQFNNALYGITGNIDLLEMAVPDAAQIKNYVNPMKDSAQRMANLTNQLLAYARGGKYQAKIVAINQFLSDTLPILSHIIRSGIRLETDLCAEMLHVEADVTQMQMVLSAILINASEAIETQGCIQITTHLQMADTEFLKHHPGLKPGLYVCLAIADNGKGMDQETRNKIFEPFFTTKFPGRGLGMASAYGIVKNHDGWISVASELDAGTQIQIYLPVRDVPIKTEHPPEIKPRLGTGNILLIEDEEIIIDVVQAMLKRLGYQVVVARNGTEAVDIVKTVDQDIDLVLLDIKLPDMNGGNIYAIIKDLRPDLKVIVCSGYSIDGPVQEILNAGALDFIKKPFSFEILAEKLSKALETKS